MKVLVISSWYPNKFSEEAEFIQRMAESVSNHCSIAVLNATEADVKNFQVDVKESSFLEVVVYYPSFKAQNAFMKNFGRLLMNIKAYYLGCKELKRCFGEADILHLQVVFPAGYFSYLYLLFHRVPLIVTEHWSAYGAPYWKKLRFFHKLIAKICVKKADYFTVVSDKLAYDMNEVGLIRDYIVVSNVLPQYFSASHSVFPELITSPFVFLHVSSLVDRKNVAGIIKSFSRILYNYPNAFLKIVGSGENIEKLERMVKELQIEQKVVFTGFLSHEDVAAEMNSSHSFVLFSHYETFSCVVMEALASGLPVISSKCGGITDWVTDEVGRLVEIGDESGLTNAMVDVIENYDSFRFDGIEEKLRTCTSDAVGKQFFELYQRALSK